MANLQHSALTTAQVHEPKGISSSVISDSGKVITPSSTVAGTSDLRNLVASEINELDVVITAPEVDTTAAEDTYIAVPFNGILTQVHAVISDPLVTADNVYTITIAGTGTTPATLTVTQAASAAGDVFTETITAGGTIIAGQAIRLLSDGGNSDANVKINFSFTIRRA